MPGEILYEMYQRAMSEEGISTDDFDALPETDKNVWSKLEDRVNI